MIFVFYIATPECVLRVLIIAGKILVLYPLSTI